MKKNLTYFVAATLLMLTSCQEILDEILDNQDPQGSGIVFKDHSTEPALLKKLSGFEDVAVYPLISSTDKLPGSPDYTFGGSADGSGLIKTADGYALLVNNEDNYAVSRIYLNENFKPIKGEYGVAEHKR